MKTSIIHIFKTKIVIAFLVPMIACGLAYGAETVHLDSVNLKTDNAALQRGAKAFVDTCMGCHSASFMRYNMLTKIGLTEKQIQKDYMPRGGKVGELMDISMNKKDSKKWFGTAPPDLTLLTRQRDSEAGSGVDWLYTYLRSFYVDSERPTGWNNTVFENVGMPNPLWQLQGIQTAKISRDPTTEKKHYQLSLEKAGTMNAQEYDEYVTDLVSFMAWMAEPMKHERNQLGVYVLIFLAIFFIFAYALKRNYWRDIH